MNEYSKELVPVKAGRIPSREIDGCVFAITPDDGFLHNFNEVGSLVWSLIDGARSLGDIETEILASYDVAPQRLTDDLTEFFGRLRRKGLVEYRR